MSASSDTNSINLNKDTQAAGPSNNDSSSPLEEDKELNTTNLNLVTPSKSMETSSHAQKDNNSSAENQTPLIKVKAMNLDLNTSLSADTTIQYPSKNSLPQNTTITNSSGSTSGAHQILMGSAKISIPSHQFSLNSTPDPNTQGKTSQIIAGVGDFVTPTPSENNKKLVSSAQTDSSINISPQSMTFNHNAGLSPPQIKIQTAHLTSKDTLNSNHVYQNGDGGSSLLQNCDLGFGSDNSAPVGSSINIKPSLFKLDPLPAKSTENFPAQDSLAGSSQQNFSVKIQTPTLGPNSLKLSTTQTASLQKSQNQPINQQNGGPNQNKHKNLTPDQTQTQSLTLTSNQNNNDPKDDDNNDGLNLEGLTDESDDVVQTQSLSPSSKPKTSGSSSKSALKPVVELKSKSSSFIQNTQRLLDNPLLGKQPSKTSMASSSEEKDVVTPLHKTQSMMPNMMRDSQFDDCKFNESLPKQFQFSTYSAAAKIIEKLYADLQHAVRIAKEYRQDFLTLQAFIKEHFKSLDLVLKNRVVSELEDQRTFKVLKSCFDETPTVGMTFASPLVTKKINPTTGEEQVAPLPILDFGKEFQGALSGIRETQNAVDVKIVPATLEKFTDILMHKPLGLHFTGHGVENSIATLGQQSFLLSNQGNCLIFEKQDGSAHYISQSQIKDLFQMPVSSLKFVFIATCHSEFAGEIFHNAGVDHVICVRQKDTLLDDAAIFFTKKFYRTLFSEKYTICEAFSWAKSCLRNHPDYEIQQEADKIILLLDTDEVNQSKDPEKRNRGGLNLITESLNFSSKKQKHVCSVLGPFRKRDHELIEQKFVYPFDGGKVTDFVGRQREMQEIIGCVLQNRFTTVIGVPGIGKTTIAKSIGSHFDERKTFEDGVIFISMRGKDQATHLIQQMFLFFNKFQPQINNGPNQPNSNDKSVPNSKQFANNVQGAASNANQQQTTTNGGAVGVGLSQTPGQIQEGLAVTTNDTNKPAPAANQTNLVEQRNMQGSSNMEEQIFNFLAEKQVLIILDNLEDVLRQDDENLRVFLSTLLTKLPLVSLLTTSRQKVSSLGEITEKSYELNSLTNNFTIQLLEKKALREIQQSEIDELFQIQISQKIKAIDNIESGKSPDTNPQNGVKNLEDHHLLALLGGHPHAVSLIAPFLQNDRSLSDLYRLLVQMTESGDFMKDMSMIDPTHSLKISMDTSTLHLRNTQPEALSLFCLLGMLPGGVSERDLPTLWRSSEVIVTCEILRRASLVVVRTEQRVLETKAKGVKTYRLLPFMNKYAESLLSPFDRLRKHNQCVDFLLQKCLEIFVQCNAEEYRGIQDQVRIQLLEIETNLWSCIYRVCDLNRERNEAKELDRKANKRHQQDLTGYYSSAADEFEAVLLSRTHISINNMESEEDSESIDRDKDSTFQLSNALVASTNNFSNFKNNGQKQKNSSNFMNSNPAQGPTFGFNRKNQRGTTSPRSISDSNNDVQTPKTLPLQQEQLEENSGNQDDYSFQNPEEISFQLKDSNQNTIKDILSDNDNDSQHNVASRVSSDDLPQYKQTKQVSFMLQDQQDVENQRSRSALGQQTPQNQNINRLNESNVRKNANSGLSAPRRGSQRTNEKGMPFNADLSQIEVASKGMTDSDTLNARSFGFLQNKTDPDDNFDDTFSGVILSAASVMGSIRSEHHDELVDQSLESPTRWKHDNRYFDNKLQRSSSLNVYSQKKNQIGSAVDSDEDGESNHSFGPKPISHRRSLVIRPNESDHLTEDSRRKSTKSVKNIGVAFLDDLYLSESQSDQDSSPGFPKMARRNLFCKSERLVNDTKNAKDSSNNDFSPTSPHTNALNLSFNTKTKSNRTKRSVEADSSLQNEGSKTLSSGQNLNQTMQNSEQNQSTNSPRAQKMKSTLNSLNRLNKIAKNSVPTSSALKSNLETIQERGEMIASSRLIVVYVSILILIHQHPEAIRVIDLVVASHVSDSLLKANLRRLKAIALMKQNNLSVKEAYSYFKDAATLFEKIGNKSKNKQGSEQNLGVAQNLFGMGLLMFQKTFNFVTQKFDETKCLKKAETFLQEAYEIYKSREHLAGQVICLQKLAMVRKRLSLNHINLFQESRKLSQLLNNQLKLAELKKKELASKSQKYSLVEQEVFESQQYILRQDGHEISVLVEMIDKPQIFRQNTSTSKSQTKSLPSPNMPPKIIQKVVQDETDSKQRAEKRSNNTKAPSKKQKARISAHQIKQKAPTELFLQNLVDSNQSPNDSDSEGELSPAFNRKSGKTFASQEREQISGDRFTKNKKHSVLQQASPIELNQVAFQSQDSSTETGSNQNVNQIMKQKGKKSKKPRVQLNNFLSEESQEEKEAAPPSYQTSLALPEIDEVPIQRRQQQIQLSKAENDILKAKMQYQNKIQKNEEMQNKQKTINLEKQMARKKKTKKSGKIDSPKASQSVVSMSSSKNLSSQFTQQEEQKVDLQQSSPEQKDSKEMQGRIQFEAQELDFDDDDLDIPIASQGSFLSNSIQFEKVASERRRKSSIVSNNSVLSFSEQSDNSAFHPPVQNNNYFQQNDFAELSAASSTNSNFYQQLEMPFDKQVKQNQREEDFEQSMQQQAMPMPMPSPPMRQKLTDLLQIGGGGGGGGAPGNSLVPNRNSEDSREQSSSFKSQRKRPTKYDHVESKVKSFISNKADLSQNLTSSVPSASPYSQLETSQKKKGSFLFKDATKSVPMQVPSSQTSSLTVEKRQERVTSKLKASFTKESTKVAAAETQKEELVQSSKTANSLTSALKTRVTKGMQSVGKSLFGNSKSKK